MRGSFFGPPSEEGASHLGRFGNLRIFQATAQPAVVDVNPLATVGVNSQHQDAARRRPPIDP